MAQTPFIEKIEYHVFEDGCAEHWYGDIQKDEALAKGKELAAEGYSIEIEKVTYWGNTTETIWGSENDQL